MPNLRQVSGHEVIRALESLGFAQVRQRGSHVVMKRGAVGCVVPLHRVLAVGTVRGILKQAGIDVEEFLRAL